MSVTLDIPAPKAVHPIPSLGKQMREEIRGIKKVSRELLADGKLRRKFLQEAGILGKDGKLAKRYR